MKYFVVVLIFLAPVVHFLSILFFIVSVIRFILIRQEVLSNFKGNHLNNYELARTFFLNPLCVFFNINKLGFSKEETDFLFPLIQAIKKIKIFGVCIIVSGIFAVTVILII